MRKVDCGSFKRSSLLGRAPLYERKFLYVIGPLWDD